MGHDSTETNTGRTGHSSPEAIVRAAISDILAVPKEKRGAARKKLLQNSNLIEAVAEIITSQVHELPGLLKVGEEVVYIHACRFRTGHVSGFDPYGIPILRPAPV